MGTKMQVLVTQEVVASNYAATLSMMESWVEKLESENEGFYLISSSIKPQSKEDTYKLIVRYGYESSED